MAAIAEWAADTPNRSAPRSGHAAMPLTAGWCPAEATIRRTLARVDPTALAAVIGAWLADRDRPGRPGQQQQRRRAVAVDGKTLRAPTAATAGRSTCSPRWTTPPVPCSPNARSTAPP
jgi:hypothetical protein